MGLDPIYLVKLAILALVVILVLALRRDIDLAARATWGAGTTSALLALFSVAAGNGQTAATFMIATAVAFGLLARRGGG